MVVIDFLASDWSPGGQCGYIVPGQTGYNVPSLPGQTGYIVRGCPGTMRGVLVLIAPTVMENRNYFHIFPSVAMIFGMDVCIYLESAWQGTADEPIKTPKLQNIRV